MNITQDSGSLFAARRRPSLRVRLRRLLGLVPDVPQGRLIRSDGRFEDCWGDCGENGLYCCDGAWEALRRAS